MRDPLLDHLSDEALLKQDPEGEEAAFEELARRYETRLFYFARRVLRDEELARDAVQETLFRAWSHRLEFRRGARFSTWLFTIALNWCRDLLRRRWRERTLEDGATAFEAQRSRFRRSEADPAAEAERHEISELIVRALEALPPTQATLLKLRAGGEMGFGEAAKKLGLSETATRATAVRAYKKLRHWLKKRI